MRAGCGRRARDGRSGIPTARLPPAPRNREPIAAQTDLFHQRHAFVVAVIVVAGRRPGLSVPDRAGPSALPRPWRRSAVAPLQPEWQHHDSSHTLTRRIRQSTRGAVARVPYPLECTGCEQYVDRILGDPSLIEVFAGRFHRPLPAWLDPSSSIGRDPLRGTKAIAPPLTAGGAEKRLDSVHGMPLEGPERL